MTSILFKHCIYNFCKIKLLIFQVTLSLLKTLFVVYLIILWVLVLLYNIYCLVMLFHIICIRLLESLRGDTGDNKLVHLPAKFFILENLICVPSIIYSALCISCNVLFQFRYRLFRMEVFLISMNKRKEANVVFQIYKGNSCLIFIFVSSHMAISISADDIENFF